MEIEREIKDDLKFLSQTNRSLHEARIGREFKMVISMLTFFAACVVARYSLPPNSVIFHARFSIYDVCILIAFILLAVFGSINLVGSMKANKMNQNLAQRAEDYILEDLKKKSIDDLPKPEGNPNKHRWIWQMIILIVGALISAILIIGPSLLDGAGN